MNNYTYNFGGAGGCGYSSNAIRGNSDGEIIIVNYNKEKPIHQQLTQKEKHFCKYCHTNSEETNSRGNCIACGAPFGEERLNIDNQDNGYLNNILWKF